MKIYCPSCGAELRAYYDIGFLTKGPKYVTVHFKDTTISHECRKEES